ncbi:MAG: hypothetical protein HY942_07805 [Gammaproteobacteria bacterium]|nr:hypothetical protein [Gammaproteobacteria bacterium]
MRTLKSLAIVLLALFMAGCANPLNQATSDRYSDTCAKAERNGRLDVAEEACYRALVNVDWGNLGEIEKSNKLYNLARIKRLISKYNEAEKLNLESLAIEDKQKTPSNEKVGRRLAELAMLYEQKGQSNLGVPYVKRLFPIADTYSGNERNTVSAILYVYSLKVKEQGDVKYSETLKTKALAMGFDPKILNK